MASVSPTFPPSTSTKEKTLPGSCLGFSHGMHACMCVRVWQGFLLHSIEGQLVLHSFDWVTTGLLEQVALDLRFG